MTQGDNFPLLNIFSSSSIFLGCKPYPPTIAGAKSAASRCRASSATCSGQARSGCRSSRLTLAVVLAGSLYCGVSEAGSCVAGASGVDAGMLAGVSLAVLPMTQSNHGPNSPHSQLCRLLCTTAKMATMMIRRRIIRMRAPSLFALA